MGVVVSQKYVEQPDRPTVLKPGLMLYIGIEVQPTASLTNTTAANFSLVSHSNTISMLFFTLWPEVLLIYVVWSHHCPAKTLTL